MFETRALDPTTWPAYAELMERHHGVWSGCWCMGFHEEGPKHRDNRERKEQRVRDARAHAALVFDQDRCVGWAQFGSPDELPRIKHKREYTETLTTLPDWRITCFFVDRDHRRSGVAYEALEGALTLIAEAGGGEVVSFPNELEPGKRTSSSFLHNGTRAMFERAGFTLERHIGKSKTVMRKTIAAGN
jgi:GNAT superfamily N-acetyltransferase